MYGLARVTASYRVSGIFPKAMMELIIGFVAINLVQFSTLRNSQSRFYQNCIGIRTFIRSHPLNAVGAVTKQAKLRQGL